MEKRSAALASHHDRPAPLGTTVKTIIERQAANPSTVIYSLEMTVLEVVRGEAAAARFKYDDIAETPLKPGFEYLLARLRLRYYPKARGLPEYEPFRVADGQFKVLSQDGQSEFGLPQAARQPEPPLIGTVIAINETVEGWILLQAPLAEKEPLLSFDRDATEDRLTLRTARGLLWFKLYSFDPTDLEGSCVECRRA